MSFVIVELLCASWLMLEGHSLTEPSCIVNQLYYLLFGWEAQYIFLPKGIMTHNHKPSLVYPEFKGL